MSLRRPPNSTLYNLHEQRSHLGVKSQTVRMFRGASPVSSPEVTSYLPACLTQGRKSCSNGISLNGLKGAVTRLTQVAGTLSGEGSDVKANKAEIAPSEPRHCHPQTATLSAKRYLSDSPPRGLLRRRSPHSAPPPHALIVGPFFLLQSWPRKSAGVRSKKNN